MGVARLLDDHGIPVVYVGIFKFVAYSSFGWWSCGISFLGNDYWEIASAKILGICTNGGYYLPAWFDALCQWP